jgi:membrane-associated phospholipid phosphatase
MFRRDTFAGLAKQINPLRLHLNLLRASFVRPFLFAVITGAVFTTTVFAKGDAALHYLKAGRPSADELLAPPPLPDSAEQAADMAAVVSASMASSSNDMALALSEKKFSVFNFTPAVGDFFKADKLPRAAAFFQRVQQDAIAVTDAAKEYWKRPRPYTLNPSLASGKLEKSFSYPSGHATESMVLALVLAEACPDRRDAIMAIGCSLGWHRVWIGRHYPTDIYAGRVFAKAIVREMKANHNFLDDLAEARAEITSAAARTLPLTHAPVPVSATH